MKKNKKKNTNFFKLRFGNKSKKQERIKKYIVESILLSLLFTTIIMLLISFDVIFVNFYSILPFNIMLDIILTVIIILIILFIFIFIIDYLFSERLVRKYRSLVK